MTTDDRQAAQGIARGQPVVTVHRSLFPIPYPLSFLPSLLLLAVFALYAPALGIALLHDDAANVFWLLPLSWANLFAFDANAGGAAARPVANALWLFTRDLFGWFSPPIIHAWNLWLHVLNTALVYALARRIGKRGWGIGNSRQERRVTPHSLSPLPYPPSSLFPLFSAAFFAFFPYNYQPVIWAGSIYHPVLLACGLCALLASLRGRWGVAALGIAGALLAHEGGFVFAIVIAGVHIALALRSRARPPIPALLIGALGLAYPLLFRFVLGAARFAGDAPNALRSADWLPNALYFMQGFVSFASARLRPIIGLTPDWPIWIAGSFVVAVVLGLALAARARLLPLALAALAAWTVIVAPAIIGLDRQYVVNGPRLHYSASVAIALFWSAALVGIGKSGWGKGNGKQHVRVPIPHSLFPLLSSLFPLLFLILACLDSAVGTREILNESLAVSHSMFTVDRELRTLPENGRVLYVNAPWYFGRASPRFLVGSEGMPIYQHDGTFTSTWIGAQSNTLREAQFVHHEISLTRSEHWLYGIPGDVVDDAALAARMLASDAIWRWDYDAPGIRARKVARLMRGATQPAEFTARLRAPDDAAGDVTLVRASAQRCDAEITLDVEWHVTAPPAPGTGVKVHGFAADGAQVFNADAPPLAGLVPFSDLPAGLRLRETRTIRVDPAKPTPKVIALGLYRAGDFAAFGEGAVVEVGECWEEGR